MPAFCPFACQKTPQEDLSVQIELISTDDLDSCKDSELVHWVARSFNVALISTFSTKFELHFNVYILWKEVLMALRHINNTKKDVIETALLLFLWILELSHIVFRMWTFDSIWNLADVISACSVEQFSSFYHAKGKDWAIGQCLSAFELPPYLHAFLAMPLYHYLADWQNKFRKLSTTRC